MAKRITSLFSFELISSKLNTFQDDYILMVSVTEKSTGRKDTYSYSCYWDKCEPENGYFNNYVLNTYLREFNDDVTFYIRKKFQDELIKGDEMLESVTDNKLNTFINSI